MSDASRFSASSLSTHRSSLIFANATRDELWLDGVRIESRLSHGVARDDGDAIVASDDFDEELVRACEESLAQLRRSIAHDARAAL